MISGERPEEFIRSAERIGSYFLRGAMGIGVPAEFEFSVAIVLRDAPIGRALELVPPAKTTVVSLVAALDDG